MSITIHGREYVTVAERIKEFNEKYLNGAITTDMAYDGEKIVRCAATICPDVTNAHRIFTGHAEERRDDGQINRTSATENCESSAVGRALAMMGIGLTESIASADEVLGATRKDEPFPDAEEDIKICPACGARHKGKYPKCISCYLKDKKK